MTIIAASILSADFAHLGRDTKAALAAGADAVHFDVMDHHFVPNLSFGALVCEALRKDGVTAPIDVHLMVTDPESYIEPFAKAGANRVTFHPETVSNVTTICEKIHDVGMQAGFAFNPNKPVMIATEIFAHIDLILIMSVFAGFGGQSFITDTLKKIRDTRHLIDQHNPKIILAVDGGVNVTTIGPVVKAGADFVVVGSGLFGAKDYAVRIQQLRDAMR
ncbi:MAG: ribulose-phosphate 3-epimerase [Gammaproteobacteria bacterium RIFCSPLOWO2_02_FULL_42_14]|nr:MAG: ribulose-phosphate 3-epimerase [Gammaproteobacteria bacterium RIFCSPHIGHO2_02_FULL_42_43]OGT29084.1 MAG: ribulose-phosphate 3-epimerase [Gammaproteobacteria bacterium RIFCSPHIGHO2_01_FULL_42_8]OGT52745.1 MAG: ribulose-phosphate 3-epimerase [Gammaproteobacteria bacterium RIFCSPHIGHO2_12_FULL_41_25]OGT63293.1 MAG: ribulose-phosphate 3-epimerase [Gammaproteobacteria bacterium RIFCSPLOWO2_02_FULL_42_14]OGT86881.1 MAG: ribulose-phosphate 3-epimerase [Gammaproteobacteria bacterium RIFCSPLOWO2